MHFGLWLSSFPALRTPTVGPGMVVPLTATVVCPCRISELLPVLIIFMFCEFKVVAAVHEDMTASFDPSEPSFESMICVVALGLLTIFSFLWRGYRSIQSRLYLIREKRLALELANQIKVKCDLIDKVCLAQEEYEALESSLKDTNVDKASEELQSLQATYKNLERDKSKLEEEILLLEKELEKGRAKLHEEDELMSDISKMMQSLADESKSVKSQLAEAKTTLRTLEINNERLKGVIKDTLNENSQLQESLHQYLEEAKLMKEQNNQLNKQKISIKVSNIQAEQVLKVKEKQMESLMESLLRMKDWNSVLEEDVTNDGNQPKGVLRKLIYATELHASLQTLEGDRNQIYTQLSEIDAKNDDLTERIRNLKSEQVSLQSANTQLEIEKQKLQRKITVMTELYQDNERKLHRKLIVEENWQLEKEEKLSKVNKRISHVTKELETYRQRAKDLEEELERTIYFHQGEVIAHEQRAHDYWMEARALERNVNELKRKNALQRQILAKAGYSTDDLKTEFVRDGPVPSTLKSRKSTTKQAPVKATFPNSGPAECKVAAHALTPPLVPKVSGPRVHGVPATPGNPRCQKPPPPPDAQQYVPSRGFAGPWFPPKSDGPVSSTLESGKNAIKHNPGKSTLPYSDYAEHKASVQDLNAPLVPEVRHPRGSAFPGDLGGHVLPPPPVNIYGDAPQYVPPRDFPGPPFPPMPGRKVCGPRDFPPYLYPRVGFFLPLPYPPENIYGDSCGYFPTGDFPVPPFPPMPARNAYESWGFIPYHPIIDGFFLPPPHFPENLYGDPRPCFPPWDLANPPFHPFPGGPVSSTMESGKFATKHEPMKTTLSTSGHDAHDAAVHDWTPPLVPELRRPNGPAFAGDSRGQFPPPSSPGNIWGGPGLYVPPRDFVGPQFTPKPDGPVSSTLESGKSATGQYPGKANLPTSGCAAFNAGHVLTLPIAPEHRDSIGPVFAADLIGQNPLAPTTAKVIGNPGQDIPPCDLECAQFPPMPDELVSSTLESGMSAYQPEPGKANLLHSGPAAVKPCYGLTPSIDPEIGDPIDPQGPSSPEDRRDQIPQTSPLANIFGDPGEYVPPWDLAGPQSPPMPGRNV